MKTVVAVDLQEKYKHALNLLKRLDFENASTYMLHVIDAPRSAPSGEFKKVAEVPEDFNVYIDLQASAAIETVPSERTLFVAEGHQARKLLEFADTLEADLVCATATHHGALNCYASGSICRALAIGAHQSILVARGGEVGNGPLSAVFATDHSPYANQCAEKLMSLNPCGLSDITVLSVMPRVPFDPVGPDAAQAMLEQYTKELAEVGAKTLNLAQRFEVFGATSRALVRTGIVNEEISSLMVETGADLLILGAQGHGFFERLFIGSVSLHEIVSEPYPVLVIRA